MKPHDPNKKFGRKSTKGSSSFLKRTKLKKRENNKKRAMLRKKYMYTCSKCQRFVYDNHGEESIIWGEMGFIPHKKVCAGESNESLDQRFKEVQDYDGRIDEKKT